LFIFIFLIYFLETALEMIQLSQDFVHAAKTYGKIIISEVFMEKKVRVTISFLLSLSLSLFSPLLCS
jgi:hypothetical protein